jgi:hypothetical protein
MTYQEKLEQTKSGYPFENWLEAGAEGLEQYTPENCNAARAILDHLIAKLIDIGPDANESAKLQLFKDAIEALNRLDDEVGGDLIETGEREDLCALFDQITIAAGLDPKNYGEGEGIADQWRNW